MSPSVFEGSDRITLTGVKALGYHGVLPEERANGQLFVVDVVVHVDVREAGLSDALDHTIDYAVVAGLVVRAIKGPAFNLIEALAQSIADLILALDRISAVEVIVHKPSAPIDADFDDVSVSIVRSR